MNFFLSQFIFNKRYIRSYDSFFLIDIFDDEIHLLDSLLYDKIFLTVITHFPIMIFLFYRFIWPFRYIRTLDSFFVLWYIIHLSFEIYYFVRFVFVLRNIGYSDSFNYLDIFIFIIHFAIYDILSTLIHLSLKTYLLLRFIILQWCGW